MVFPHYYYQFEWTDCSDYSADIKITYHDMYSDEGKALVQEFHIPQDHIDKWSYDDLHEFLRVFVPKAKSWKDIIQIAEHLEKRWC